MKYCFIDVETTGRRPSQVIQIGAVVVSEELEEIKTFSEFLRPDSKIFWDESAVDVHGISWEKSLTFQNPRQACVKFLHFIKEWKAEFPLTMVYHANAGFDWCAMERLFFEQELIWSFRKAFCDYKKISTLSMARKMNLQTENKKLSTLAEYFGHNIKNHHDALDDAMACYHIYKGIRNMAGNVECQTAQKNSLL